MDGLTSGGFKTRDALTWGFTVLEVGLNEYRHTFFLINIKITFLRTFEDEILKKI